MPDAAELSPSRRRRANYRRPRFAAGIELPRIDGRTQFARRFRRLVVAYANELGNLTDFDRAQVAQLVTVELRMEQLRAEQLQGRLSDGDELIRLSSEHRRIANGLRANATAAKPAGPTLHEHLARRYGAQADAEGTDA
jgi:hypothetical protein